MPIIKPTGTVGLPTSPNNVKPDIARVEKTFVTPVVDTRKESYDALATFASGHKWACDYFIQLSGSDTAPSAMTWDKLKIYTQLKRVRGFELIVTSPMSVSQNSDTNRSFSAEGSASVYGVLTTNEGDFFIADVGDGRNGVFLITSTKRRSTYKESFTDIEFKQLKYVDATEVNELESRIVETVYFDRELMRNSLSPILTQQEVDVNKRLIKAYRRLSNQYIAEFLERSTGTLLLPQQGEKVYDPYMATFVKRVFDRQVVKDLAKMKVLDASARPQSRVTTVLDIIEQVDIDLLYSCAQRASVLSVDEWRVSPYFRPLTYSGLDGVVAIHESPYRHDHEEHPQIPGRRIGHSGVYQPLERFVLPEMHTGVEVPKPANHSQPWIHPLDEDDYYIFSTSFYENRVGESVLENIVRKRLSHEPFDVKQLADLADQAQSFDNIERFYYVPVIVAMIKMVAGVL